MMKDMMKRPEWFRSANRKCPLYGSADFWEQVWPFSPGLNWGFCSNYASESTSNSNYVCLGCENEVEIACHETIKGNCTCSSGTYTKSRTESIVGNKLEKTSGKFTTSFTRAMEREQRNLREAGKHPTYW